MRGFPYFSGLEDQAIKSGNFFFSQYNCRIPIPWLLFICIFIDMKMVVGGHHLECSTFYLDVESDSTMKYFTDQ